MTLKSLLTNVANHRPLSKVHRKYKINEKARHRSNRRRGTSRKSYGGRSRARPPGRGRGDVLVGCRRTPGWELCWEVGVSPQARTGGRPGGRSGGILVGGKTGVSRKRSSGRQKERSGNRRRSSSSRWRNARLSGTVKSRPCLTGQKGNFFDTVNFKHIL